MTLLYRSWYKKLPFSLGCIQLFYLVELSLNICINIMKMSKAYQHMKLLLKSQWPFMKVVCLLVTSSKFYNLRKYISFILHRGLFYSYFYVVLLHKTHLKYIHYYFLLFAAPFITQLWAHLEKVKTNKMCVTHVNFSAINTPDIPYTCSSQFTDDIMTSLD